jgi:peroxiredoxin
LPDVSIIAPGTPLPDDLRFETYDGEGVTTEDLKGSTTVLVFYPFAFSPVCTDQLQVYEELLDEIKARDAKVYGVSTDAVHAQQAFKEKLGITIEQLSDFEPKGRNAKELGAYFDPAGMTNRALVVADADGIVRWSYLAENPGVLPGVDKVFEGLDAVDAAKG